MAGPNAPLLPRPLPVRLAEGLAVVAASVALAVALTWPLAGDLSGRFVDGRFQWSMAWTTELVYAAPTSDDVLTFRPAQAGWLVPAWADPTERPAEGFLGRVPTVLTATRLVDYPRGGTLILVGWANLLLGAALRPFLGLIPAFNLTVLASLALAPLAAWAFARAVGLGRWGAALAALAFACHPFVLGVLANGQVAWYDHGFLALLALATWRAAREGLFRHAALVAVALVLTLATSPYYLVTGAILAAILGAWALLVPPEGGLRRSRWRAAGALGLGALAGTGLCLPLLAYFTARSNSLFSPAQPREDAVFREMAAGVADLFLPRPLPGSEVLAPGEFHFAYLGIGLLVLAVGGLAFGRRRDLWPFLASAVLFGILALGRGSAGVSLPFGWMVEAVPALEAVIFTYRFVVGAVLALAILAGAGLDALVRRVPRAGAGVGVAVLAAVALDLVVVSGAPFPAPVTRFEVPAVYADLAADPEMYGVVSLPCEHQCFEAHPVPERVALARLTQQQILLQAFHRKGLGMVDKGNRDRPAFRTRLVDTAVRLLAGVEVSPADEEAESFEWLHANHFRYLFLHGDTVSADRLAAARAYLTRVVGAPVDDPVAPVSRFALPPPPGQPPAGERAGRRVRRGEGPAPGTSRPRRRPGPRRARGRAGSGRGRSGRSA